MNYRHAFHAGNFADVFKHAILLALLDALTAKDKPLCYFDTHAGRGVYALDDAKAQKTGEWRDGIGRLSGDAATPAPLRRYLDAIRACNPDGGLHVYQGVEKHPGSAAHGRGAANQARHVLDSAKPSTDPGSSPGQALCRTRRVEKVQESTFSTTCYPGSPLLAAQALRADDRLVLCELQDEEASALRSLFRDDPRVHVHRRDGYAALHALLPPPEKRGLVLIDPPFEAQEGEFATIAAALAKAHTRWPNGVYAAWYPIKSHRVIAPFHRRMANGPFDKLLVAELLVQPDDSPLRLNGCGMLIANPPWQLNATLAALLRALLDTLAQSPAAATRLRWLLGEQT